MIDPRDLARADRHADRRNRAPCPAGGKGTGPCTCVPEPDRLDAWWQGRSRMAAARRAAGVKLDAYDRQALDRYPPTTRSTP